MLKNWSSLDGWDDFKKVMEAFEERSIPNIIKKVCYIIRSDLINNENNSFNKNYIVESFDINIIIEYNKNNKIPYHSDINLTKIITNPLKSVDIKVFVTDIEIDINYLMSIISHEIRHIYDIYTISRDHHMLEFKKSFHLNDYYDTKFGEFVELFYLSLEHEFIARHNMLYELYRWIEITDKKQLYNIFKTSFTYKALIMLKNFDSEKYINKFNRIELIEFTKEFSNKIEDKFIDIDSYYKKFEIFFHKKSDEFLSYVDSMLDDIIK
jgi:hypothetical protein